MMHTLHRYNEYSLLLTCHAADPHAAHTTMLALAHHLGGLSRQDIQEVVKAYHTALFIFTSPGAASRAAQAWPHSLHTAAILPADAAGAPCHIPVCYDPVLGSDLPAVAASLRLSIEEVVQLHTSVTYKVFMIGFLPGFAYMGTLPKALHLPRKHMPVATRAGSVAIAGAQTGIYPLPSPGGWHVLGHTALPMFLPDQMPPVALQAGQEVRFYAISLEEYTMSRAVLHVVNTKLEKWG